MEIEEKDSYEVMKILNKLGIEKDRITTLDVASVYDQYGIDVLSITHLKFEDGGKKL
jgi:hypothetical protein